MKIYESGFGGTSGVGNTGGAGGIGGKSGTGAGVGSSQGSDHVDISSALGSLSRALSSFSSDRSARVQALATQYQSGQYKVDAAAVGRAMVSAAVAASAGSGGSSGTSGAGGSQ